MAKHRTGALSVVVFLLLVLAAAGLSTFDLALSDRPGDAWSTALEQARRQRPSREDREDRPADEGRRLLLTVTCRERTGEARRFLIARPLHDGQTPEAVVADVREVLALHLAGSVSVEVVESPDGATEPAEITTDLLAEWE